MTSVQKILSSLYKLISSDKFESTREQLKLEILEEKWTIEQKYRMVNNCLIATNMRAHEMLKNNSKDLSFVQPMFQLTEYCCNFIEKTWQCKGIDFMGSILNISRYFLSLGCVYETLVISQYSMAFAHEHRSRLSEGESNTVKLTIFLCLNYLNSSNYTEDRFESITEIWKFIFSPYGLKVKNSNLTNILETFQRFCYKAGSTNKYLEMSFLVISYLNEMHFTDLTDSHLCTLIAIYGILIGYSNNENIEKNIQTTINSINDFSSTLNSTQRLICSFCCDILRFSICSVDASKIPVFIDKCIKEWNSVLSLSQSVVNHVTNFVYIVIVRSQNCWINDNNFFYIKYLSNVIKLLSTIANKMESLDKNQTAGKNYFSISNAALSLVHRIQDLTKFDLVDIYPHVKKCLIISSKIYKEDFKIDNSRNIEFVYNTGAHSVKVFRTYMKAELYSETKDLCLIVEQQISCLPIHVLQNPTLQPCIEKLVYYMYRAYRSLDLYSEALKLLCNWSIRIPNCQNIFMDYFASLKAKLASLNETKYLNIICWDLVQDEKEKNPSSWKNVNLFKIDVIPLLKCELKQYISHQVHSAEPIEKIINISKERNDITKIEFHILGSTLLTQSSDFLDNAMKLLPSIEIFIEQLDKKMAKNNSKEKMILYSSLLGSLHFSKFRIKLLNARCENEKEVILTSCIKTVSSELGIEQETRDDSDVIHKYLTYRSQQEIICFLDTAVDFWFQMISEVEDKADLMLLEKCHKVVDDLNIQTFVQEAALMYRLYCHELKETRAWKLLYLIAEIRGDNEGIVYAFSNLMRLNAEVTTEWKNQAQNKLTSVEKITQIRYRLETIHKLFINGRRSEGAAILSQISEDDVKYDVILKAKYYFFISQYKMASSYYPETTAVRAYSLLMSWIKTLSWKNSCESCEAQSLLLDITLFIGYTYLGADQIKLARGYLKELVNMVQKLCLPLRICEIIIALSKVSVSTWNLEDIYVKLNALKNVLKFNADHKEEHYKKQLPTKVVTTLSPDFSLNSDVRFVSNFSSSDFYSSPILESGLKYDMPEFVNHESTCHCVACDDVQLQRISCEIMFLFASYFYQIGKCGQALQYFKGTLEMLNKLRGRWRNTDQTKDKTFLKIQIITKMRQGDFWASCGDFEKAEVINREALYEYEHLIVPDEILHGELREQYLALKHIKLSASIKKELPKKKASRRKPALGVTITKTPANKESISVFQDDNSQLSELIANMKITPCPSRSRRLLVFKKDDEQFTTPCKPPASARISKTKQKKDATPPDIVMQTPSSIGTRSKRITDKSVSSSVEPTPRLRTRKK